MTNNELILKRIHESSSQVTLTASQYLDAINKPKRSKLKYTNKNLLEIIQKINKPKG